MENTENKNMNGKELGLTLLQTEHSKYSTLDLSSKENQVKLYNSLQQCDVKLMDIKGQTIEICDVFIERKNYIEKDEKDQEIINEVTGEVKTKPHYRTILFGTDGKTYVSAAYGIYNSLNQLISIFGAPTKENPLKVQVTTKQLPKAKGESLILLLVND